MTLDFFIGTTVNPFPPVAWPGVQPMVKMSSSASEQNHQKFVVKTLPEAKEGLRDLHQKDIN